MSSPKFTDPPKKRGRPSKPVDPKSLGGRIRAARERLGLTTVEVASKVGVSQPTITDTEIGNTNPERRTLILLAQVLNDTFGLDWLQPYVTDEKSNGSEQPQNTRAEDSQQDLKQKEVEMKPSKKDEDQILIEKVNELPDDLADIVRRFIDTTWRYVKNQPPQMITIKGGKATPRRKKSENRKLERKDRPA